jgi:hypothetical protein
MYEKWLSLTQPGTETKVTPEIEVPIMANATTYHLDFLFPMKNASLSAFLPVKYEMQSRTRKYIMITIEKERDDMKNQIKETQG